MNLINSVWTLNVLSRHEQKVSEPYIILYQLLNQTIHSAYNLCTGTYYYIIIYNLWFILKGYYYVKLFLSVRGLCVWQSVLDNCIHIGWPILYYNMYIITCSRLSADGECTTYIIIKYYAMIKYNNK